MKIDLGESQEAILANIANSNQPLIANRLAEILNVTPVAISKSLSSLLENKLLISEENAGKKFLKLTDKGACYVFLYCQTGFRTILANHKYLKSPIEVTMIEHIIPKDGYHDTDQDARQSWKRAVYENIFEIIVNHDEFDGHSGEFLYTDHTLAVTDGIGNNLGFAGYSARVLRVVNYIINELTPHHDDWIITSQVKYYIDYAKGYFNEYVKYLNGRMMMLQGF